MTTHRTRPTPRRTAKRRETVEWTQKERVIVHARRFGGWWICAAISLGIVGWVAQQQLEVLVYKVLQVNIAVLVGYVADRSLLSDAPAISECGPDALGAARVLARAIIVAFAIVGITIGI